MPQTQTRAPPQCVNLDKLEAAPSEAALVARAMELLAERRFWAGVVVLGPADAADPADPAHFLEPGHVRIKIRMDIDDVTRTNKIRDRWGGRGVAAWGGAPASHLSKPRIGGDWDSLHQLGSVVGGPRV